MTYRQQLRELSFDTHGVVTVDEAVALGVPAVEVRKLAARGALTRLGHGVYRMLEAPAGALDEFAEAVALAGDSALLADEAVLAALGVAQVNLRRIRVVTPHRVRAKLPDTVDVVRRTVPPADRTHIDGVPAMTVVAALRACRGRIMVDRLIEAAREAASQGLISAAQEASVVAELVER